MVCLGMGFLMSSSILAMWIISTWLAKVMGRAPHFSALPVSADAVHIVLRKPAGTSKLITWLTMLMSIAAGSHICRKPGP